MFGFIALGVSIVSTLLGASEQNKANKQNKKSAKDSLAQNNRDISIRSLQEKIAAAIESRNYSLDAAEAASSVQASAGAGNVGGMTVDILLQDIENQKRQGLLSIESQSKANLAGLDRERAAALMSSRNQARQTSPVSPFAVGLRIGADILDFADERTRRRNTTNPDG